ncbi:MAG: ATP-binding protein [bacterium]
MNELPFTLDQVVINSQLAARFSRPPDFETENDALKMLSQALADEPQTILQKLVEVALRLCRADTAGISLLENHDGKEVFRWEALAGVFADRLDNTMPRYASPCGTTIDRNATQLMYLPERFFTALKVEPPVVEALLIPFHFENKPVGTVWVLTHDERRKFDREDERIVGTLAQFAGAAWQLWKAWASAESATKSERQRTAELATANENLRVQVNQRDLAEKDLENLNEKLEARVVQRTVDLVTANEELRLSMAEGTQLQAQLRHAQKMESFGTLAGGIAHDFNNLLNAIQSYALLMKRAHLNDPAQLEEDIKVILDTATEGASLVRQLLTVARKTEVKFELTDINSLVSGMIQLMKHGFPQTIAIDLELGPAIHVLADTNQLRQVLLNLCINAKDAMRDSGTIRLRTKTVNGNELQNRFPDVLAQSYSSISVADTGSGMDEKIRERIFEPFYTTKEAGRGTGLGLSVVYGIIKAHNGFIDVESEAGQGTAFHIYLPVSS